MPAISTSQPSRPQPHSLSDLTPNSLYIALYSRDGDDLGKFHWAIYHQHNAQIGGMKYHIRGNVGRWIAAHESTKGILKEFLLVGLVRIASINEEEKKDKVDRLARVEDKTVNQIEGTTCRVWVRRFCERLRDEGLVTFESWERLERELVNWGIKHNQGSLDCVQPRPLWDSRVCGMMEQC
ncbi:hypothetical protein BGZ60DRAFT_406115 [Tricladium varicosporioides]|nr:hypothetical protein BGZ60DRAFT_406115 [Hymenoscyphus varicosporioides]